MFQEYCKLGKHNKNTKNYNLIQNSPAVKKVCGPQKAIVKKDVKSKVAAKKWL